MRINIFQHQKKASMIDRIRYEFKEKLFYKFSKRAF